MTGRRGQLMKPFAPRIATRDRHHSDQRVLGCRRRKSGESHAQFSPKPDPDVRQVLCLLPGPRWGRIDTHRLRGKQLVDKA
jgi:hypothetical protein